MYNYDMLRLLKCTSCSTVWVTNAPAYRLKRNTLAKQVGGLCSMGDTDWWQHGA